MHALRAGGQDETILTDVPLADRRARLHVVADETVVDEGDAGDLRGGGEGRLGLRRIADLVVEGAVRAKVRPDQRRFRIERRGGRDGGVLLLVFDLDQFGGVLRQRPCIGDDEGDGVADIIDPLAAEDRDVARRGARAVRLALHGAGAQIAEVREVGAGQHQMDALGLPRRAGRRDPERRLGDGRPQHVTLQHPFRRDVVGVAAAASDERFILDTKDRSAHPEFRCDDCHDFPAIILGNGTGEIAVRLDAQIGVSPVLSRVDIV